MKVIYYLISLFVILCSVSLSAQIYSEETYKQGLTKTVGDTVNLGGAITDSIVFTSGDNGDVTFDLGNADFKLNRNSGKFGPNLITNGTFDDSTGWIVRADMNITNGTANFSNGSGNGLTQEVSLQVGKKYVVIVDILYTRTDYGGGLFDTTFTDFDLYVNADTTEWDGEEIYKESSLSTPFTYYSSFICTQIDNKIELHFYNDTVTIDNVFLYEVLAESGVFDIYVDNKKLQFDAQRDNKLNIGHQNRGKIAYGYYNFSKLPEADVYDNLAIGMGNFTNSVYSYENTGIGLYNFYYNLDGYRCTGIGDRNFLNSKGNTNTGIGVWNFTNHLTGNANTGIGIYCFYRNKYGVQNVGIGSNAGYSLMSSHNVAIGANAGYASDTLTSQNITVIGSSAYTVNASYNNVSVIGYNAQPTVSNQIVLGNAAVTQVKVGELTWFHGTGSPEGVVTAPIGSFYSRKDGGAGTTLYVKNSGSGNTGWGVVAETTAMDASYFKQNGNSFSGAATVGTNDNNSLNLETNNVTRLTFDTNGSAIFSGRMQGKKGANIASANNLTLGTDGNLFHITGATQINAITTANWQAGSEITLIFDSTPTVKNNTAGGGGTAVMLLAGGVDFAATANDVLKLVYDGTSWFEVSRSAN